MRNTWKLVIGIAAIAALAAGLWLGLRQDSTIAQEPECQVLEGGKAYCSERDRLNPPSPIKPGDLTATPEPRRIPYQRNDNALLTAPPVQRFGPAHQLGRADCPSDWNALVSDTSGMSICLPSGWRLSRGGLNFDGKFEETALLVLGTSKEVVSISLVRLTGLSGPWSLHCANPESTQFLSSPALRCIWGEGANPITEPLGYFVPLYIEAYKVDRPDFQWAIESVIWPDTDATQIEAVKNDIQQILNTLKLP